MRRIRIGTDFEVRWSLYTIVDGQKEQYMLENRKLMLQYCTPYGMVEVKDWSIDGNTIVWKFKGKEQRHIGCYQLIMTENPGEDGMLTVDSCNAFELVAYSYQEHRYEGGDVDLAAVDITSSISFCGGCSGGGGGSIDPEIHEGYMPLSRDFSDDFNNDFTG
jgi:hypothetical protein